ncbi:MAG: glycosyltransferase family 4 protein [Deltaproteobacteria bacterium]|nr:glycosyltransferase family 4 protein [Deltaproteobacteria bacterium]
MAQKFFLISQVFYPDETATAAILTDIAAELAKDPAVSVEVWCAQPSYSTRQRQKSKVIHNNMEIFYMPGTNFPKAVLAGRLLNYLTFSLALFVRLLCAPGRTPVFTVTNPPFLGILVWLNSRLRRMPYVYIVHDVQPDGLLRLGMLKKNSFAARVWTWLNRCVLRGAERIVVIGRDMVGWVEATAPSAVDKTVYIPNCQDEQLIKPLNFNENLFVKGHQLADSFVVQYSGNMGLWNDMKSLALAARRLCGQGVQFCFIGAGMRQKELFEVWGNVAPENTLFLPFQPKNRIGASLTACHVALISLRRGLEGIAVPSKLYGILAAGVAVIAQVPQDSEVALTVGEAGCGIVVEPGDDEGLVRAILYLKEHERERLQMGRNARQAFEKKFTSSRVAEQYHALWRELPGGESKTL